MKASYIWHHLHIKSLVFTNLFLGPKQCKSPFTWSYSLILISLTVVIRFIAFRFCATFAFKSAKFRGSTSDYFVKNDWTAILKRYHGSNERMQIFFLNQRRIMMVGWLAQRQHQKDPGFKSKGVEVTYSPHPCIGSICLYPSSLPWSKGMHLRIIGKLTVGMNFSALINWSGMTPASPWIG